MLKSMLPRHNFTSNISFKYLIILFTIAQCTMLRFDMNWLTTLTANATSAIVSNIADISDSTASF